MAIIKRNIWALFVLVLLGGAAVLSVSLAARWQTILSDEQAYQAARAELVGQAVESLLRTQELVLDVIGRELLRREEGLLDASRQIPLLDSILEVDPILRGSGWLVPTASWSGSAPIWTWTACPTC